MIHGLPFISDPRVERSKTVKLKSLKVSSIAVRITWNKPKLSSCRLCNYINYIRRGIHILSSFLGLWNLLRLCKSPLCSKKLMCASSPSPFSTVCLNKWLQHSRKVRKQYLLIANLQWQFLMALYFEDNFFQVHFFCSSWSMLLANILANE